MTACFPENAMLLHQRFIPGLAIASYIFGDEKSGEAAVIDPTRDVEAYIQFAKDHDLQFFYHNHG